MENQFFVFVFILLLIQSVVWHKSEAQLKRIEESTTHKEIRIHIFIVHSTSSIFFCSVVVFVLLMFINNMCAFREKKTRRKRNETKKRWKKAEKKTEKRTLILVDAYSTRSKPNDSMGKRARKPKQMYIIIKWTWNVSTGREIPRNRFRIFRNSRPFLGITGRFFLNRCCCWFSSFVFWCPFIISNSIRLCVIFSLSLLPSSTLLSCCLYTFFCLSFAFELVWYSFFCAFLQTTEKTIKFKPNTYDKMQVVAVDASQWYSFSYMKHV